jgi:hypothetical protein
MSFWKRLFGKADQPVSQDYPQQWENPYEEEVVDDQPIESAADDELDKVENPSDLVVEPDSESSPSTEEISLDLEEKDSTETEVELSTSIDAPEALKTNELEKKIRDEKEIAEEQARVEEELLQQELEAAEAAALQAQLEIEAEEFLEDLSVLDGRILPELKVPDWREELEFVKERYEPCDLSDHIVKVSKRRQTVRQIDHELALSRLSAYERYLDRASRRFKDKIDEDALLNSILTDLNIWRNDQGRTVAWRLADRINQEVLKAKQAEEEAISFVENNTEFVNPMAVKVYRAFARRAWSIPIVTLYICSVVGLTYNALEWIMKFLPFFNLGISKTLIMISGVGAGFWISNLWKYSKSVARIQRQFIVFKGKHQEQHDKIVHAVKQHTRLAQQQPMVEPILEVLAKGYRVQLQSDVLATVKATTEFNPDYLPACVTLARALDNEEEKMMKLRTRASNVLKTSGWRTAGLDEIIKRHADSRMLDVQRLGLESLDSDSLISSVNTRRILLEAFGNMSIHNRVSKSRLIKAIREIHNEVLANFHSADRPKVESLRNNGFNHLAFRTSWLADEDGSESWISFLTEVLTEETAPFGQFNILDKRAEINSPEKIKSVAAVPHYFKFESAKIKVQNSLSSEVAPLDVVVRVDVSPWADTSAFTVFADDIRRGARPSNPNELPETLTNGGFTSA